MKQTKDLLRELKVLAVPFPEFDTQDLPEYPSALFMEWMKIAIEEGVYEPHSMTLSTIDETGAPDARILILKDVTRNKWYFATSSTSRKGEQLKSNSQVALTFYWSAIGRQVRIRGVASKMTAEASSTDFLERSNGARAIALMGNQSKELTHRDDIDEALVKSEELIKQFPDPVSPVWTMYEVEANEVEFWQGDSERKHTRVQYQRKGDRWEHRLLWP
ncbi:pyridoxal 5'-phosphate synthase [Lederbergia sp. NSJ-179]|uniref:pyridoxine/pyridoxamine 5'-phosphate oxidase n=1 Tax=Lederbergia sp. NSJ-179 TaxID=2931402 RepID=UPI001FD1E81D|nr:pyridoxal 5'-phosphate synthase [Lederbergia sp. NSJ-179]MCJ7842816.1 pyridoxal 5'-phosphate synthase [Lederbergia sp. NSJ-179]